MSTTVIVIAVVLAFSLGVLVGNGFTTLAQEARSRRQATTQRRINAQLRRLGAMPGFDSGEFRRPAA
jgi:hypothetical protein